MMIYLASVAIAQANWKEALDHIASKFAMS